MIAYKGLIDGVESIVQVDDGTPVLQVVKFTEKDTAILEIIKKEANKNEIAALKQKLAETDYIACKIAEGAATREEYAFELEERRSWREQINQLEESLK